MAVAATGAQPWVNARGFCHAGCVGAWVPMMDAGVGAGAGHGAWGGVRTRERRIC